MIEIKKLCIEAGRFRLSDISFDVQTGLYTVLMGMTGQGKSTILETICGLRKASSGEVLLHGIDVTDWLPSERQIGYVPQDLALFPNLSVYEHLAFALSIRRETKGLIKHRVSELAERLQISHLLTRRIHGLSGGEKQRVAIGRALSFRPKFLMLDEPLSALDEMTRLQMHVLLKELTKENEITTLHVTHSEAEAVALADCRLALQDGQIIIS